MNKKSYVLSVLLTVLFGPFGIFYTSGIGGLVLTAIAVLLLAGGPVFVIMAYPLFILFGLLGVYGHNKEAKEKAAHEREEERKRLVELAQMVREGNR